MGEHPRPHPVLRNPGSPSLTVHPPHDPTSPKPLTLQPCHPPRTVLRVPGLRGRAPAGAARAAGTRKGTGAHSKLPPTQPANFWAAARNARRPELSRSAEPSRRGCPGCSPPGGGVSGRPAALRRGSIHTPAQLLLTGAYPVPTPPAADATASSSHQHSTNPPLSRRGLGAARPAPAIPLGVPPPLAAHPEPFYLRRAALRTDHRLGVAGPVCASGLILGRVSVSRGRGRPRRRAASGSFRGLGRRKPQQRSGLRLARLSAPALL